MVLGQLTSLSKVCLYMGADWLSSSVSQRVVRNHLLGRWIMKFAEPHKLVISTSHANQVVFGSFYRLMAPTECGCNTWMTSCQWNHPWLSFLGLVGNDKNHGIIPCLGQKARKSHKKSSKQDEPVQLSKVWLCVCVCGGGGCIFDCSCTVWMFYYVYFIVTRKGIDIKQASHELPTKLQIWKRKKVDVWFYSLLILKQWNL